MTVFGILLSWSSILVTLLKMLRRMFTTFVDLPAAAPTAPSTAPASIADLSYLAGSTSASLLAAFRSPAYESLNWLHREAPSFPVRAASIRIITEPAQFYDTLVDGARNARQRIVLASLYLGTGTQEHDLVRHIGHNLRTNPRLNVNVLLDFARGTRGTGDNNSSKAMLMPLLRQQQQQRSDQGGGGGGGGGNENVCVSLYHTPALRGLSKRLMPPRWNELIGLQHMKLYVFDDTVIVSGANLSRDYFTNRQDRYIVIEDRRLADFYARLVGKVQQFSFQVQPDDAALRMHPAWAAIGGGGGGGGGDAGKGSTGDIRNGGHPFDGSDGGSFVRRARESVMGFFAEVCEQQRNERSTTVGRQEAEDADTWIFPLIEMGQLGIHHDSLVTQKLLSKSQPQSQLRLATGYFNLTDDYMRTITDGCAADCSILMAHPSANGFQGAKGAAGGIPAAYTLIARNFHKSLVKAGQQDRVKLFEYEKSGWSYHAKGLWYYLPGSKLPNLTLIGSSNFGERSVNRDLESQVCLVTENETLQRELQAECDSLYRLGSGAEQALLQRPVPKWVRAVVSLFRNYF